MGSKLKRSMKRLNTLFAALIIPSGVPDIEIKNFNLVESHLMARSLELHARKAQLYQKERTGLLHNILSKIWNTKGSIYELKAEIGAIDTVKQDMLTQGKTTIVTPDSYRLETSNVTYLADKKTLSGTDEVLLSPLVTRHDGSSSQGFHLKGMGLLVDLNKDIFRVLKSVRADQRVDPNTLLRITSQSFEFDILNSLARFVDNVQVTHPQYRLNGRLLDLRFGASNSEESTLQEMFLRASLDPTSKAKVRATIDATHFTSQGFRILFAPMEASPGLKPPVPPKPNSRRTSPSGLKTLFVYG
jgi:hypothetical protein